MNQLRNSLHHLSYSPRIDGGIGDFSWPSTFVWIIAPYNKLNRLTHNVLKLAACYVVFKKRYAQKVTLNECSNHFFHLS